MKSPKRQSLRRKMGKRKNRAANKTAPHPVRSMAKAKSFMSYMKSRSF